MNKSESAHGPRPDVTVRYDETAGWVVNISGPDADLSVQMGREDGAFVLAAFDSTETSFEKRESPPYRAYWAEVDK